MRQAIKIISVFLVLALLLPQFSCSGKRKVNSAQYIREHNLQRLPRFDIPVVINDRVVAWLDYFTGAGRKHFRRYLQRSGRYMGLMQEILREEGMPQDLVYISLIESGFNCHARSHANAVGPWQFIRGTARRYGMQVGAWRDERRDPYIATRAAAAYYRDLYTEFGDWYLAMAGYNAGEGRVRKAIRQTGSKDFWVIASHRRALRPETRDYVPKFIAAAIIAKMPERFGFGDVPRDPPFEFEEAVVETQTDLGVVAKCAGVDEAAIVDLNPHLHRGATPHGKKDYRVRVPKGSGKQFRLAYAKLPKEERVQIVRYRVKQGDTLSKIARRYGVSVKAIAQANNIRSYRRLRRGADLVIPVGGAARARAVAASRRASTTKKLVRHRVRSGETAGQIAERYGVRLSSLRRWNKLNRRSTIRVGQRLKIYSTVASGSGGGSTRGKATHVVRRGQTIGGIARRYGVSTKELMAWNEISDPRRVRAGQKLVVSRKAVLPDTTAKHVDDLPTSTTAKVSAGERVVTKTHRVRRGQTLGAIARRYGVSTKELMAWNEISDPRRVRAGQKLVVSQTVVVREAPKPSAVTVAQATGTHTLKRGETLGHVAERYGMGTKELMALNGISNPRRVRAGRKLKVRGKASAPAKASSSTAVQVAELPTSKSRAATPPPKVAESYRYTVKSGETLGGVANRHGVTTKELMAWNGIKNPRSVRAGQKLVIKKSPTANKAAPARAEVAKAVAAAPAPASKTITYRVKSGDTLWAIARRHRVTIAQLQAWNDLPDPSAVRPGTKLKIIRN